MLKIFLYLLTLKKILCNSNVVQCLIMSIENIQNINTGMLISGKMFVDNDEKTTKQNNQHPYWHKQN